MIAPVIRRRKSNCSSDSASCGIYNSFSLTYIWFERPDYGFNMEKFYDNAYCFEVCSTIIEQFFTNKCGGNVNIFYIKQFIDDVPNVY